VPLICLEDGQTDRQTDGRTDGRARRIMWPIEGVWSLQALCM